MNRAYNHITYFTDNKDIVKSRRQRRRGLIHQDRVKHHANQLDDKQRHTGFDYYEYDMPIFGNSIPNIFNFQEQLEDLEHDQARRQAIHGHGRGKTCCSKRNPISFQSWH